MFMMKCFVVFDIVGIICVFASSKEDFRIIDSVRAEWPCTVKGGMCTIADDCPALSEERGLCNEQKSQGVECCYGISVRETRCQKLGGMCFPAGNHCNPRFRSPKATDCPNDSTCCILVKK